MTKTKLAAFASAPLALALALAACGGDDTASDGTAATVAQGEVVAPVAAPEGTNWVDTVVRTEEGGWLMGNPNAPIKLIEYGSLTCPGCAQFAMTGIEPLKNEYVASGRVSFEFRSFAIHGVRDVILTRLIECSAVEAGPALADQIWLNLEAVETPWFQNQAATEQALVLPPEQRLVRFAEITGYFDFFAARGLAADAGRACLADVTAVETLAAKMDSAATEDDVRRTPTFLINGTQVDAGSWAELEPLLQRAGAREK